MRIALLRRKFNINGGGGAEKVAANFVREFISRGHSISVFSEEFEGETSEKLKWEKVPKTGFAFSKTAGFHKNAQKALKSHEFDIVYSLCRTYPVDVFRVTEQLHSEWLPIYYSKLAEFNPRHRSILELEKKSLSPENTKRVVTNSELVKKQVVEKFNYPEERISVVRNGVDKKIFYPIQTPEEKVELKKKLSIPKDKTILLFAAGNFKIKGLEQAMRALAGISKESRDKTLLIALGGDNQEPYEILAQKLGLEGNLEFPGKKKNMRDYYSASDLLLYPSMYEPFANVCLEACACGLPVLTTRLNGSSELIKHGKNGYLLGKADELNKMSEYIEDFLGQSNEKKNEFSREAVKAAESCDWKKHADELECIFIELTGSK
jgi:UDP-glucose:(heptosyl)LPS alpha-1,3-glucosyltransferase